MSFSEHRRRWLWIGGLALLVTALNALKPLYIDDPYYWERARHIQENPLDPNGYVWYWHQWPQPSMEDSTPPLVPYWLAGSLALFGDDPAAWKFGLFPFVLLFCASVFALAQRFASSLALPLTTGIALGPAFLPGWNAMLDGPTAALTLAALAVFLAAADTNSRRGALAAGLLAGLALQSKWVSAIGPPLILLWGLLMGRLGLALLAAAAAGAVFVGWELLTWFQYGDSLFLWNVMEANRWRWELSHLALALLPLLGALNIGATLIVIAGVSPARWPVWLAMAAMAGAFSSIAWRPVHVPVLMGMGVVLFVATGFACTRLGSERRAGDADSTRRARREDGFLLAWLALEIVQYLAISPNAAARRMMGAVLVMTLLTGRFAAAHCTSASRRRVVWQVTGFVAAVGVGFALLDLYEARITMRAPAAAAERIRAVAPDANLWYVGHWGFGYYADRAGMRPVFPDHTRLREGDWLVVPDRIDKQEVETRGVSLRREDHIVFDDDLALQTMPNYYLGSSPLEHRSRPRLVVHLYRVIADTVLPTSWDSDHLAGWVRPRSTWASIPWAVPALESRLKNRDARERRLMATVLGELGAYAAEAVPALEKGLGDREGSVRTAAARALGQIGAPAEAARPALETLQDDDFQSARKAAREAIQAIDAALAARSPTLESDS